MSYQQQIMQMPRRLPLAQGMQGGIGGLGGGLDRAFAPLKQVLSNSIAEGQVEPFVEEVKQMAQERFDLGGGMSGGNQFGVLQPQPLVQFQDKSAFSGRGGR